MKRTIVLLIFFLLIVSVSGHSNILYDVDIDFDIELKERATKAAQEFLGIDSEPVQFDYDRELINVKFGDGLDHYVVINPVGFEVFGFRDDNLVSRKTPVMTQDERKAMADTIYDTIPEEFKSEMIYGEEKKLYTGTLIHTWYRYIDNVIVLNDHLQVEIDGATKDIVSWRLSPFFYPKTQVKTTPAITHQVAQHIALLVMDAEPLDDSKQVLVIDNGDLLWQVKVKKLYPLFVYVDAMDGRVLYVGSPRGDMPESYDYGREGKVVPTDSINTIINS